ncbi:sulfite exporter TauE/SafE family protein [Thalassotalea euphylliae]|uniref:Probable membrane transporter protein n=1 Tax=Thalassotalea euphylliae TaxID=1655234 RepID=A0A3E0TSC7_9GAMM|nr:sulfite exporter TauE/SafE family protein [Thalassotalea euphylliae]REL27383.1 sulfite exporter TauE/SafE family protein [Thalassotalea euphylliae]
MLEVSAILVFLALGSVVGFLAGLLGVGGGGILVPALSYFFIWTGAGGDNLMHIALGTSMACIIVTSFSSLRAHQQKGAVVWDIVKVMSLGIVLGTFAATYIASYINSLYLAILFSCFMFWTAMRMIKGQAHVETQPTLDKANMFYTANGIGAMSALVSIGGGSLTVPYLVKHSVDVKKAIGTSAAIGLPISVTATLGYLLNGWSAELAMVHTIGFVYWPAVIFISITSFFFAPLGAKAAHYLPVDVLKKIFAALLILLSVKMTLLLL